jgi:hypothetical protein
MTIPSLDRLRSDIGKTYLLSGPWAGQIPAEVKATAEGMPMTPRHCCYSATLALPIGVQLPQATCIVTAGQDEWLLLLTPVGPGEDGRQSMQMVLHYPIPQAAQTPAVA